MSTNGSAASPGTEAPSDTHDSYKRWHIMISKIDL